MAAERTPREEIEAEDRAELEAMKARHRPDEVPPTERGPAGCAGGGIHAAGTPGGGSAVGGLAGTNVGDGSPDEADLEAAAGSGNFDVELDAEEEAEAYAGRHGGAVGGTPTNKRVTGGKSQDALVPPGTHSGESTIGRPPNAS